MFHPVDSQEEQYDHLDEADVNKVDKLATETMMWMNSAMNQQSKMSLSVDPAVKAKDIQTKTRVSGTLLEHHFARIATERIQYLTAYRLLCQI